jgi:hypothetical protein
VPCRIELRWLINTVTPELADQYWEQEFTRSLGENALSEPLKPTIRRFAGMSHGAVRAESLTIDYDPELGLAVSRNGAAAVRFPGVQFSRALLGIWLGPTAPAGPPRRAADQRGRERASRTAIRAPAKRPESLWNRPSR